MFLELFARLLVGQASVLRQALELAEVGSTSPRLQRDERGARVPLKFRDGLRIDAEIRPHPAG